MSDQLEKELNRGAEATQLIDNPIFKQVMEDVENDIDKGILNASTTDPEVCLDLIRQLQQLQSLKAKIVNYIQTGKMAQQTLKESEVKEIKLVR